MKQKLDIKYNIPNIKAFLSVFNLNLEVYNDLSIKDEIKILDKEKEVGRVLFNEDKIEITSKSIYGDLKTSTDYASAFTLTDVESFDTIGTFGLFASFSNTFKFTLGDKLTGDLNFAIKLDNEFGNRANLHAILNYQDDNKKYIMKFQEAGFPLYYLEEGKDYQEKIIYNLFDSYDYPYIHHSLTEKIIDNNIVKSYYESSFIGKGYYNKKNNTAVNVKKINNELVDKKYLEFPKKGADDEEAEVINKGEVFTSISPDTIDKINSLIEEFPFLEKIFIYSFNNFSNKEIHALFGLNKDKYTLDDFYFDKGKFLVKNIF